MNSLDTKNHLVDAINLLHKMFKLTQQPVHDLKVNQFFMHNNIY